MLLLCEEYEASNGNARITAGDDDVEISPTSVDDIEDENLVQELNMCDFDEALQKNAEVWHFL